VVAAGRCQAQFVADGQSFVVSSVDLYGVPECPAGKAVPAWMVSADSSRAYAGDADSLAVRWGIGFCLILLCGLALAWITGAGRHDGWRQLAALGTSLGAPLALTAAVLIAAY
jgi:hypothetical protein